MKKYNLLLILVLIIMVTACSASESEDKQEYLLSSSDYPIEIAIINRYKDDSFQVNIVEWKFINNDMVYILDDKDRVFLVDKTNVTLFSPNQ